MKTVEFAFKINWPLVVEGTKNSSHSGINGKRKTFSDSVNVGNSAISLATTAAEVEMTNDDQQIA